MDRVRGRVVLAGLARLGPLLLAASLVVTAPGSARAQAGGDGDAEAQERRRRASGHVEEGDRHKEAGEYAKAAREYEKAYELVPHAVLFFNIAQVHRLGGDRQRALEYYERYLEAEPDGRASAQARRFAAELRREIRAEERRRQREAGGGDTGGGDTGGDTGVGDTGSGDTSSGDTGSGDTGGGPGPVIRRGTDTGAPGRGMRIAGMAAAGAGAVSLGVGVVFGLKARSISDEISSHDEGPWPQDLLDRQPEGRRAERIMFIATGMGVAAVAAGAVLYYLGHSAASDAESGSRLEAAALVTGDSFGLAVGGRF